MEAIHIEIIHQGDHMPHCRYMAESVEEVISAYGNLIRYTKVEYTKSKEHARRFSELSIALYGEEEFKKRLRCAPIPSLFINGELIFDVIPPRNELIEAIESALERYGLGSKK